MNIDWGTFVAQIINFLVLVWLLQRFLYGPIVRAMDAREQTFVDRMDELQRATREAEARAAEHRRRLEELEHARETLMAEASRDVEAWKQQQTKAAREEIERARAEWYHSLEREKATLLRELRLRAGREVYQTARTVLRQLCDAELERLAIERFAERLERIESDRRAEIAEAIVNSRHRVLVTTAFPLDEAGRNKIRGLLHAYLSDSIEVEYREQPELLCGIEVKAAGYKVAWSAGATLDELEESFAAALDGRP